MIGAWEMDLEPGDLVTVQLYQQFRRDWTEPRAAVFLRWHYDHASGDGPLFREAVLHWADEPPTKEWTTPSFTKLRKGTA